ncbi:ATP-binding protein [Streptomyces sp. NPDC048172]|uniref:ATP-binding protein n=1 Tax=Streptomyces sp. NPDC048172 TaxID=3365505 RepID=UPI003716B610
MTAAAPVDPGEDVLPVQALEVRDDLILRFTRTPRRPGQEVPAGDAVWVERFRRIGAAKARQWSMPGLVGDLQVLVSELVTNALQHGTGAEIAVRYVVADGRVLVAVDDGSPGAAQVRQADDEDETGRGMFLVDALATDWGVSEDGTTTWVALADEGRSR